MLAPSAPVFASYYADPLTNGNGITTGSAANIGFDAAGLRPRLGWTGRDGHEYGFPGRARPGSAAGTTNYGLHITGNGGASSTNWAINHTGTADSELAGAWMRRRLARSPVDRRFHHARGQRRDQPRPAARRAARPSRPQQLQLSGQSAPAPLLALSPLGTFLQRRARQSSRASPPLMCCALLPAAS